MPPSKSGPNGPLIQLAKLLNQSKNELTPKAVHRLRTTIRRIDAFMDFARPKRGKKLRRIEDLLASARKRAGDVRDSDVQLALLDSIANRSTVGERQVIAARLEAKRERAAKKVLRVVDTLREHKSVSRLRRLLVDLTEDSNPLALEDACKRLRKLAERSSPTPDAKDLHKLRNGLKKVRYTAELAPESAERTSLIENLKGAQDSIGHWHDHEMLLNTARKVLSRHAPSPLVAELRALEQAHFAEALQRSALLLAEYDGAKRRPPQSVSSAPSGPSSITADRSGNDFTADARRLHSA